MNYKILGMAAAAMLCAPLVNAQTETLDYTGSAFTNVNISGNNQGFANPIQNTGELVLSSPLGDNLHDLAVIPVSFSFDGNTVFGAALDSSINSFTGPADVASFRFSTDAHGMLTAWDIVVSTAIFQGDNPESSAGITINTAGDSFSADAGGSFCLDPAGPPPGCFTIEASSALPGVWKASVTRAPEIDPALAGSGLTLLLGGLAVLRGLRKLES
jgi:hypothetical protein